MIYSNHVCTDKNVFMLFVELIYFIILTLFNSVCFRIDRKIGIRLYIFIILQETGISFVVCIAIWKSPFPSDMNSMLHTNS